VEIGKLLAAIHSRGERLVAAASKPILNEFGKLIVMAESLARRLFSRR